MSLEQQLYDILLSRARNRDASPTMETIARLMTVSTWKARDLVCSLESQGRLTAQSSRQGFTYKLDNGAVLKPATRTAGRHRGSYPTPCPVAATDELLRRIATYA